jgi:hypothetical protein
MITFGVEDTFPLSDGNFHNKKSIISEHYGFTDALLDPTTLVKGKEFELDICDKGHIHIGVDYALGEDYSVEIPNDIKEIAIRNAEDKKNAAHVAFENFINQPLTTELDLDYE